MLRKNIKFNSIPRKLCILNFEESRDVFGNFSNEKFDNYYKSITNKSELRGIDFTPIIKELELNSTTVQLLKKQCDMFQSLFYWFIDVYKQINTLTKPKQFSQPQYVEDLSLDDSYLFIFNDFEETSEIPGYNLDNYLNFMNMYSYPEKILKVNKSILRSHLNKMMDIEGLKVSGIIRDFSEENLYEKILKAQLDGRIDNNYFKLAAESILSYNETKRLMDSQNYADEKLKPYESEYLILKNLRLEGEFFARHDFTIDRIIFSKTGIYILSLVNYGDKNHTIEITQDNKWLLTETKSKQVIKELPSPVEELSLNCIAIKKLIRINYGEDADKISIKPVVVIANDNVRIHNLSHNEVIRGSDIYNMVESQEKTLKMEHIMDIGTTLYNYRILPLKNSYRFYTSDLESAEIVYQDLYYNHVQFYLPKLVELIWKIKKEDYYHSNIKKKSLLILFGSIGFIGVFIRIFIGLLVFPSFSQNYISLFLWNILMILSLAFTINEYRQRKSWISGAETGDCYEVENKLGIFGGIQSLLFLSLFATICGILMTVMTK